MNRGKVHPTCVTLTDDTLGALEEFARLNDYTRSSAVRECVRFTVANQEERARWLARRVVERAA